MLKGGRKLLIKNVSNLCKNKGITFAELEREIGLGNGTIRRWEASSPSVANVKKVADFFGCTVDDLLKGQ